MLPVRARPERCSSVVDPAKQGSARHTARRPSLPAGPERGTAGRNCDTDDRRSGRAHVQSEAWEYLAADILQPALCFLRMCVRYIS